MDTKQYLEEVMKKGDESHIKYAERLHEGLETNFMNQSIVKIAENFINLFLAPLQKEITFIDKERDDCVPLFEYLEKETQSMEKKKRELLLITDE